MMIQKKKQHSFERARNEEISLNDSFCTALTLLKHNDTHLLFVVYIYVYICNVCLQDNSPTYYYVSYFFFDEK